MKKYRIVKIAFAKDIKDALIQEDKAELVAVELADEIINPEDRIEIGFKQK